MRFRLAITYAHPWALGLLLGVWLTGCGSERLQDRDFPYKHLAEDTQLFGYGEDVGTLESDALTELSGIAASQRYPHVIWAHNDSGDGPYLFALDTNGKHLARFELAARAYDWEAMAVGAADSTGASYVYIADVGDNEAVRPFVSVYRLPEPDVTAAMGGVLPVDTLHFEYPDGPRDAETFLVDPRHGGAWVVTKREDSVRVYAVPLVFGGGTVRKARFEGQLPIKAVTGGSINPQTGSVLLRTYNRFFLFRREGTEPLWAALQRVPIRLPYFPNAGYEPQGEAVTWDATGTDFFSLSEEYKQTPAVLYRYRRN